MNSDTHRPPLVSEQTFAAGQTFNADLFAARYGGISKSILKPGALLYAQGQPANCVFYLEQGQIQLSVVSLQGKEAIIAVLNPGDFCGEGFLIGEQTRLARAVCIADSVVKRLEQASVIRAIRSDPLFAEFFLLYFLNRSGRLTDRLISQLIESTEQRLARLLLLLANPTKEERHERIVGKLDQEALAQMIGTTRSRVNHFMNKFRRLGYIDYDAHIEVHGSLSNLLLHEQRPVSESGGRKTA